MTTILMVEDNEPGRDAPRAGAPDVIGDDFETKPIHFQQLMAKIERLVARVAAA